jgi:signal transduction histidine kinase
MKSNRLGLLLILSVLAVIATVVALSAMRQKESDIERMRVQGVGMTRSLSMLPLDVLAPKGAGASVLHTLLVFNRNADFAYGAVTAQDGQPLVEVANPGLIVPATPLPAATASLFGERVLDIPYLNKKVREFYGPVMKDGRVTAFLRIAYFEPQVLVAWKDLSFLALLALPTFLLVPLIYLVIRREMRPLGELRQRLHVLHLATEKGRSKESPVEALDVSGFAGTVSRYVDESNRRIGELESEKVNLLTTNRFLEYNSNKMNFVLHCLPDALLILDPAGNINFASAKIKPLIGADIDAILTQPLEAWCKDEALRELLLRYRTSAAQAMRPERVEFQARIAPDKRIRASAQPLVPPQEGMVFGTLLVLRDVTLEQQGQQAGHDFVAQISHELKSPLNNIAMYAETLQQSIGDNPELQIEAANVIHDEAERMAGLVNNMLSISKMETGGLKPHRTRVRLDELLQDIFNHMRPRAEAASVTLEMDIPKGLDAIHADKEMLRIAINNMLTNALKYNEPGGRASLEVVDGDGEIVITVRDNGIGIPEHAQAHVFEKFFRAGESDTQKRSGHGLGLYLTSEIVRLHHGRMSLESAPGQGSAFSIHLKKTVSATQEANML